VHAYYNSYTKRRDLLCDHATNPNIAVVSPFMCAPTDEEALAKAEGSTFFQFALGFYNSHGPVDPGTVDLWQEYQAWRETPKGQAAHRARGLIGSPETLREKLRRFEDSHVDQVILLNQAGKNRHEDICASLELFAGEVMGEFVDRHDEHEVWKQEVLSGERELAEIDTEAYRLISNQTPKKKAEELEKAGIGRRGAD
jgi:alkanesulfonate monooxygenase SsuD/methylene tetrahydromethanopterin reductase-like flavin-dependent oxidoreductase (luciferase family)